MYVDGPDASGGVISRHAILEAAQGSGALGDDQLAGFFSNIGKAVKKVAAPLAKKAVSFIPGGSAVTSGLNLAKSLTGKKKVPAKPVVRVAAASVPAVAAAKADFSDVTGSSSTKAVKRVAKPRTISAAPPRAPDFSDVTGTSSSVAVAKRVVAAGTAAKSKSNKIADQVRALVAKADSVAKLAAQAAATGDDLGARRFAEQARQIEDLTAKVQAGATQGAAMIQQAGAAVQGAAVGGVAAAGAEGAKQSIMDFFSSTTGKLVGVGVLGGGILLWAAMGRHDTAPRQWQ